MKSYLIAISILVLFVSIMFWGMVAAKEFVRWMGWPMDILPLLALVCILLVGIWMGGWQMHNHEEKSRRRAELEQER